MIGTEEILNRVNADPNDIVDAQHYAAIRRCSLYLKDSNTLLLYVAWITNNELLYTIKYPESLMCDTTMDTNKEERPLLIVAGSDNHRRNFSSLKAFSPSQHGGRFSSLSNIQLDVLGK